MSNRTWRNQFPADFAPPAEVLAWLPGSGFTDTSWGNDVCPSFSLPLHEAGEHVEVRLWVDHPDRQQRELDSPRYAVVIYPLGAGDRSFRAYTGDDCALALAAAEWTARMACSVVRDVKSMLASGELPATVRAYSAVHEHCDGNVLGDFEEGCAEFTRRFGHLTCEEPGREFEPCRDVFFGVCEAAHKLADCWLQNRPA